MEESVCGDSAVYLSCYCTDSGLMSGCGSARGYTNGLIAAIRRFILLSVCCKKEAKVADSRSCRLTNM